MMISNRLSSQKRVKILNKLQKLKAIKVNLHLSNIDKSSSEDRSDSNKSKRDKNRGMDQ